LKDIWPSEREIHDSIAGSITAGMYREVYAGVFDGDARWQAITPPAGDRFAWDDASTYVGTRRTSTGSRSNPLRRGRLPALACWLSSGQHHDGPHLSGGQHQADSPAGKYLQERGVQPKDFNQYGARRGNHEVMMRGTFANIRLKNQLVPAPRAVSPPSCRAAR